MGSLEEEVFVCFDLETTGLEPDTDRIIEIAAVRFTFEKILSQFDSLIDPEIPILAESTAIHHITNEMVHGKPKIQEVLPAFFKFVEKAPLVGHGIPLDIAFVRKAAERHNIPNKISSQPFIDTLRLARLYGESRVNSLEKLREHFNIEAEGAHRALNDVIVNVDVFKFLCQNFKTTEQIFERLKKPIQLKTMPLGKHKGRPLGEIPFEYLVWMTNKDFDQDLLFSVRSEIKRRRAGKDFRQASNPFSSL